MLTIETKELKISEELRKKVDMICKFAYVKPIYKNGNIRNIDKSNLSYIEPHRIIIKGITFLAFNYSNEIFVENLSHKIKISDLETFIKQIK